MSDRAIRLTVRDPDLERSRLTVGFRLILAIPHFIWLAGWFSLATLVAIANWIATLISGHAVADAAPLPEPRTCATPRTSSPT